MKKLCFIASSSEGIITFHKSNIDKLSSLFDIYVIAKFKDKSLFKDLKIVEAYPIDIERYPSLFKDLKALFCLYCYFKRQHFDGFISMSSKASLLASLAGFFARIPIRIRIFTGQLWANKKGLIRLFYKNIDRLTVVLNTNVLVDGKSQRKYLEDNKILKKGQGIVLANGSICGVDINKFMPNINVRLRERKKFGISNETVVFTYMGRINREKGIFELLEATNRLFIEVGNAVLVLIGNMEGLTANILTQYSNLHIGKNVILYGFTKEPYNALQLSDVFCLPSYREGFGVSAIEAASLSLPVICSDAYGLQDSFIPNVTGLCCKVKDTDSLYYCMKQLYADRLLREKFGLNGRKRVVEMFDSEILSTAWLQYFKGLIK